VGVAKTTSGQDFVKQLSLGTNTMVPPEIAEVHFREYRRSKMLRLVAEILNAKEIWALPMRDFDTLLEIFQSVYLESRNVPTEQLLMNLLNSKEVWALPMRDLDALLEVFKVVCGEKRVTTKELMANFINSKEVRALPMRDFDMILEVFKVVSGVKRKGTADEFLMNFFLSKEFIWELS